MSDADEIKRHEWIDPYLDRPLWIDFQNGSYFHGSPELCREILRLANENFKLKCDLAANQGYGDGLATLCKQNRERAEKAERELAEAREAIRKIDADMDEGAPDGVVRLHESLFEKWRDLTAVKAAMEGK